MNIGDTIHDCYMGGIGDMENIGCSGTIEAAGRDWVIVRNTERDTVIFVDKNLRELEEFLK